MYIKNKEFSWYKYKGLLNNSIAHIQLIMKIKHFLQTLKIKSNR